MHKRRWENPTVYSSVLILLGLGWYLLASSVVALAQEAPTATPDAQGVIYVIVQPNDFLLGIAGRSGISLDELLALNDISRDTIIQPGQKLIIGYVTPSPTATVEPPTPTATATRPPPTATATPNPPPRTAVCVKAYADIDQDGIYDEGEPLRATVAFTIFNVDAVVGNYVTDGLSEPYCLEGLLPGDYEITRSVGRDETLTTDGHWSLTLNRGQVINLEFGSFTGSEMATASSRNLSPGATATEASELSSATGQIVEEEARPSALRTIGLTILLVLSAAGGLLLLVLLRKSTSSK